MRGFSSQSLQKQAQHHIWIFSRVKEVTRTMYSSQTGSRSAPAVVLCPYQGVSSSRASSTAFGTRRHLEHVSHCTQPSFPGTAFPSDKLKAGWGCGRVPTVIVCFLHAGRPALTLQAYLTATSLVQQEFAGAITGVLLAIAAGSLVSKNNSKGGKTPLTPRRVRGELSRWPS